MFFVAKKIFLLSVICFAALACGACSEDNGAQKSGSEQDGKTADRSEAGQENAMAIKGVDITQGEHGRKLWHLVAEEASMNEDGGIITLSTPFLTYFGEGDASAEKPLTVQSASGEIDQAQNIISFVGDVVVQDDDSVLRGEILTYDGNDKHLLTPKPVKFSTSSSSGSAGNVLWNLTTGVLYAKGGVDIEWETAKTLKK